ncbi:hypothetical protein J4466_05215 [Candidatus Pacearchaeota archaeon]|nr:hypothetical protein [Candidatus Pacearchaeota archaeon]
MLRRIKERINPRKAGEKAKESVRAFRKEFRTSMAGAIVAAFGFLIALVWKDVITLYVNNALKVNNINSELASALFVTFIAVIGIMIVSKVLADKTEKDIKSAAG